MRHASSSFLLVASASLTFLFHHILLETNEKISDQNKSYLDGSVISRSQRRGRRRGLGDIVEICLNSPSVSDSGYAKTRGNTFNAAAEEDTPIRQMSYREYP